MILQARERLSLGPGAKHANSENLSPEAMDRLDNLASWHLVMPVSMDAILRIRTASIAKRCAARGPNHFGRIGRIIVFSWLAGMDQCHDWSMAHRVNVGVEHCDTGSEHKFCARWCARNRTSPL